MNRGKENERDSNRDRGRDREEDSDRNYDRDIKINKDGDGDRDGDRDNDRDRDRENGTKPNTSNRKRSEDENLMTGINVWNERNEGTAEEADEEADEEGRSITSLFKERTSKLPKLRQVKSQLSSPSVMEPIVEAIY